MAKKYSFKEIIEEAAQSLPGLWSPDGKLNLSAMARYYKKKGHPVTQATLHRLVNPGKNGHKHPSDNTVNATYHVFGVPRALIRGESLRPEMEDLLAEHRLSTLILAKKLEGLPKTFRDSLYGQIEAFLEQREQIAKSSNVTPIDRDRPSR